MGWGVYSIISKGIQFEIEYGIAVAKNIRLCFGGSRGQVLGSLSNPLSVNDKTPTFSCYI